MTLKRRCYNVVLVTTSKQRRFYVNHKFEIMSMYIIYNCNKISDQMKAEQQAKAKSKTEDYQLAICEMLIKLIKNVCFDLI